MKKATVFGILAVLVACMAFGAGPACAAEKFVVGWQPYCIDTFQVAVMQELRLAKKYLPGVEVEFQEALHGAIHTNNMRAGKCQVGYMAVMPGNIACSVPEQADIREVESASKSNGMHCSLLMAKIDAPDFKTPEDAVKWLTGKMVATPRGSCADQFMRMTFEKFGVKPAEYLNQTIEIITTNFRAKRLDGSGVWEPTASRIGNLAGEGVAKIIATGSVTNNPDIGMTIMRGDFIDNSPHLAKGLLKCELEALLFMLDPKNYEKAVDMIAKYAVGIPKKSIWFALYGQIPESAGGSTPKSVVPFIIDDEIQKNIKEVWAFQHKQKLVPTEQPFPKTIDDHLTREVLAEAGLTSPIGKIDGMPGDKNPFR
jgi:NitT/TauT family transport system substrate-binding protein